MSEDIEFAKHIGHVCRRLCGEPNKALSDDKELRFGAHGSLSVLLGKGTWYDHENKIGGGTLDLIRHKAGLSNGASLEWLKSEIGLLDEPRKSARIIATYDYRDEYGVLLYQVCRMEPKTFRQRQPDSSGRGWEWNVRGVRQVPYRLPELVTRGGETVFIVEGEKDADRLMDIGLLATCNAGGAGRWRPEFGSLLTDRDVVVLPDNDDAGRAHARDVVRSVLSQALSVRIVELPGLSDKGDVSDWLDAGGTLDALLDLVYVTDTIKELNQEQTAEGPETAAYMIMDRFYAHAPDHKYIFIPTRDLWPASSVNSILPGIPVVDGNGKIIKQTASQWLDRNRRVEQMTWAPGLPELICDKVLVEGGWVRQEGARSFNQYLAPTIMSGDARRADMWLRHLEMIYPNECEHLLNWFAHRVQKPQEKINHALLLGGAPGIGKDTILEPLKQAVGPWNFRDVNPSQVVGRFNGYLKSVVLRISETRDLGEGNRYSFHEHLKTLTASPPDALMVDEKNKQEYMILNVCGVIMTTNHKTDGIYIPEDDRRHMVAWSPLRREDERLAGDYWQRMYTYYADGGFEAIAAYLRTRDISGFDPKEPPLKTDAFHAIAYSNRSLEEDEINDVVDQMGRPIAFTLKALQDQSEGGLCEWLLDRKNRRAIPHRLEACGYEPVRNPDGNHGLWIHAKSRKVIYARADISAEKAIDAARDMCRRSCDSSLGGG